MKTSGRVTRLVAVSVLAAESLLPRIGVLARDPDVQPAVPSPSKVGTANPTSAHLIAALRSKIPIEPISIGKDPYMIWRNREPSRSLTGAVCGVRFEPDRVHYRLSTFANTMAARDAGFAVTHFSACGTCSTLQDLAVYLEKPDLTAPVRKCGIAWDTSARLKCLQDLGFSRACAQTWLYDLQNTRRECLGVCVLSWIRGEAPTLREGRLNACLQCDEDRSGPVFKATAGRTRRNSGIRSSIPRPEEKIAPVVHDYVPDLAPKSDPRATTVNSATATGCL